MMTSGLEQALPRHKGHTPALSGQQLTIARNVFWVTCDGATIVLSMESGKYFGFDNIAALIWSEIAQHIPQDQIASAMATNYGVEVERARADIDSFTQKLQTNGLVEFAVTSATSQSAEEHPQSANSNAGHVPLFQAGNQSGDVRGLQRFLLFVEAYVLMVRTDVGLWRKGFHGLWKRFGGSSRERTGSSPPGDPAVVKSLCAPVLAAFRWYRPGAACMHRAMTTFWFLRRRGIQAALCLGVRRHPFGSHVWVEFNDQVLNDSQRVRDTHQTIARLA